MKEFKLEITFNPVTKDCKVTGPINDREVCMMGIELGKRVLEQHWQRSPIVVVPAGTKPRLVKP